MGSGVASILEELRRALTRDPPEIPCKYLYDDVGSDLFEAITRLPEYYQTRTEEALLEEQADAVASVHPWREVIELGSGAGRKIRMLLDAMLRRRTLARCVLLEINRHFLHMSLEALSRLYPDVEVVGVEGDFEQDLARIGPGGDRLAVLFAGTIGNLPPERAVRFLRSLGRQLRPGDGFLVGMDLVKDPARLVAAYDDARGVTAAFNLNVLRVVNRRFGGDFDPDAFHHVALWDPERQWIEMRLEARRRMRARVEAAGVVLDLAPGDQILTEVSAKYTRASAEALARAGGFVLDRWFQDADDLFALALLRTPG